MTQDITFLDNSKIEDKRDNITVEVKNLMLNCRLQEIIETLEIRPDGFEAVEIQNVMAAAFCLGSSLARRGVFVDEVDEADDYPFEEVEDRARVCRLSKQATVPPTDVLFDMLDLAEAAMSNVPDMTDYNSIEPRTADQYESSRLKFKNFVESLD